LRPPPETPTLPVQLAVWLWRYLIRLSWRRASCSGDSSTAGFSSSRQSSRLIAQPLVRRRLVRLHRGEFLEPRTDVGVVEGLADGVAEEFAG
jgi:hypothetical protein